MSGRVAELPCIDAGYLSTTAAAEVIAFDSITLLALLASPDLMVDNIVTNSLLSRVSLQKKYIIRYIVNYSTAHNQQRAE